MSQDAGRARARRILAGFVLILLTMPLAFSILWGVALDDPRVTLLILPLSLWFALSLIGVQAIIHSLLMEFIVWRFVGIHCLAILVSALLGLVGGLGAYLMLGDFLPTFLYAGFVAGLTTGLLLGALRKRHASAGARSPIADAPGTTTTESCSVDRAD